MMELVVLFFGFVAGFIDSIAGGGGLITLPVLMAVLDSGPDAVGTNKIIGSSAALAALIVYARAGHFEWKRSLYYALAVGIGGFAGSFVTPLIPPYLFRWFILLISPLILWLLFQKDIWTAHRPPLPLASTNKILFFGLLAGFYDGMWGPGGGTFMFLVLFLGAKMPLFPAIATSKLANVFSASFSLVSFASRGYVHWGLGTLMASTMVLGAFIGARHNTKSAAKILRPVLVVITTLLIAKVFMEWR